MINAAERVEALAPRDFMAVMILAKNSMSIIVSSSVHQFGGDRLGKFASLQACATKKLILISNHLSEQNKEINLYK